MPMHFQIAAETYYSRAWLMLSGQVQGSFAIPSLKVSRPKFFSVAYVPKSAKLGRQNVMMCSLTCLNGKLNAQ